MAMVEENLQQIHCQVSFDGQMIEQDGKLSNVTCILTQQVYTMHV